MCTNIFPCVAYIFGCSEIQKTSQNRKPSPSDMWDAFAHIVLHKNRIRYVLHYATHIWSCVKYGWRYECWKPSPCDLGGAVTHIIFDAYQIRITLWDMHIKPCETQIMFRKPKNRAPETCECIHAHHIRCMTYKIRVASRHIHIYFVKHRWRYANRKPSRCNLWAHSHASY